jgi:hypothetical protein
MVMIRSIKKSDFFVHCTNRTTITPKDILIGLIDSAWEYTDDMIMHDLTTASDETSESGSASGSECTDGESESEDEDDEGELEELEQEECELEEHDSDGDERFSAQLSENLSEEERVVALRMKNRMYTWDSFDPGEDMIRKALARTINRLFASHQDVQFI